MITQWRSYFQQKLPEILSEIQRYVEYETPTHNKAAVDHLGAYIAAQFRGIGCRVDVIEKSEVGDQLRVEFGSGSEQLLVLGHFDTVKEVGTLSTEPWRVVDGKAFGPGAYDMKSGMVFSYFALKAIIEHNLPLHKRLVFFWNTDEETGSHASSVLICDEARRSSAALVLEPAAGSGDLKTSRKSGGEFRLKVFGRAAHAGNDHASGMNAIAELAQQITNIQSWTDYNTGTTLSVGVVKGGTASNVVPEFAEAVIDVRVSTPSEAARITQQMRNLQPVLPGARLVVEGGMDKMPMERTADTERLFLHALSLAREEGFEFGEVGVGGTSDGNFTASVGTPTLDGLGAVGDGAHAVNEHIVVDEIPNRIALLLKLLTTL